jgi:hypothetical protein
MGSITQILFLEVASAAVATSLSVTISSEMPSLERTLLCRRMMFVSLRTLRLEQSIVLADRIFDLP